MKIRPEFDNDSWRKTREHLAQLKREVTPIPTITNRQLVHVDFDGVLIPNDFETMLIEKLKDIPLTNNISHSQSQIFNWYIDMVNSSPLASLNVPLLKFFEENKDKYALRLWTNRNLGLVDRTVETLGEYKSLFDSFEFHEGDKISSRVEGVVIDNDPKYLKCGETGIHYEWKGE